MAKDTSPKMPPTAILLCSCVHTVQDIFYGRSQRLHNWATKREKYRCTVCKAERSINESRKAAAQVMAAASPPTRKAGKPSKERKGKQR